MYSDLPQHDQAFEGSDDLSQTPVGRQSLESGSTSTVGAPAGFRPRHGPSSAPSQATLSWCGAGRGWPLGMTSMALLPSCDHTPSCLWGHHHRPHHEVSAPRHLVHRAQHPPQRRQRHAAIAKAKKTDQPERTDTKQDAPPSTDPKEDRQDFGLDSVNPLSVGRRTRCAPAAGSSSSQLLPLSWLSSKIIHGRAHADLLSDPAEQPLTMPGRASPS